jgi:hypothetical protein
MKITHRKLHIGAAIALVLYSVIYTAFVAHGNVAAAFFVIGLWVLSSFSDKTRWVFYAFLLVQAWANWHLTGLLVAIAFVGYCITQNIAYRKTHPDIYNAGIGNWIRNFFFGRQSYPLDSPNDLDFLSNKELEQKRRDEQEEADDAWRRQLEEERRERERAAMQKQAEDAEYNKKLWGGGDSDQNSW